MSLKEFLNPKSRPRRRPTPPDPHQQAMDEEKQRQQELNDLITSLRQAAGEPTLGRAGTLEERLRRSRLSLEARLLAMEKTRTAEKEQETIRTDALAQRNLAVAQAQQAEAETRRRELEESSRVALREGMMIFEAFFDPIVGLSQDEIDATLTQREKDETVRLRTATVKDPGQIKEFLKKFRNYDPVRIEQILPDEEDRRRFQGIAAPTSPYPFWNF